jgi:hypothetical protein
MRISFSTAALTVPANILLLLLFSLSALDMSTVTLGTSIGARLALLVCCWLGGVPEMALGPAGRFAPAIAAQERAPWALRLDKLDIVVDDGLLDLSDLFCFAFEVPDGLSLLLDKLGQGDK